jgi:hypothetical protein
MNFLANNGYTNAMSESIDMDVEEVEDYKLPDEVMSMQCVQFILN